MGLELAYLGFHVAASLAAYTVTPVLNVIALSIPCRHARQAAQVAGSLSAFTREATPSRPDRVRPRALGHPRVHPVVDARTRGHNMTMSREQPPGSTAVPSVQVPLDQDNRAPSQAREATRRVLLAWRLPALVDTVVLAVSELVTNGVRHGRPQVHLELRRGERRVGVRVHDDDPAEPAALHGRTAGVGAESGRGLEIVNALAVDVGVEQVPDDGKVVYAEFDAMPEAGDEDQAT